MTVLVIGNATIDVSFEVDHLPEPGETLLTRSRFVDAGGKGLNQAVVAQRAGAAVVYISAVGNDPDADIIRRRLAEEGLSTDHLRVHQGPTDQSIIYLAPGGENSIVSTAARAASIDAEDAESAIDLLEPADVLLMQGNLRRDTTLDCLSRARMRGVRVVLNPAPIAFDYDGIWPLVEVTVVNQVESRSLGKRADPEAAAHNLIALGTGAVVVTLGADGALVVTPETAIRMAAPAVRAIDTTGAGDVFCGVLTAALSRGHTLVEAVPPAIAAASLSATRRGTSSAFPTAAELARTESDTAEVQT